jgi:predicted membrane channel-forming protein YqfA (hemolysin III family)
MTGHREQEISRLPASRVLLCSWLNSSGDEKYRVASHIIGAVAIAAMAVYLFVQALNGAVVEVLGFGLVFIFLMATLSIRHRSKKA